MTRTHCRQRRASPHFRPAPIDNKPIYELFIAKTDGSIGEILVFWPSGMPFLFFFCKADSRVIAKTHGCKHFLQRRQAQDIVALRI
jgi:hypothetical protein